MSGKAPELWDLYDAQGKRTDMRVERDAPIPAGYYHPVVHVCLFNSRGEMLIQLRNPDKALAPDKWDVSAGGAGIAGEEISEAAARELYEELGIRMDFSGTPPHVTAFFDSGFDSYYLASIDEENFEPHIGTSELRAIRFASETEILEMIDGGLFVPFKKSFISLLFAMRQIRGSLDFPV